MTASTPELASSESPSLVRVVVLALLWTLGISVMQACVRHVSADVHPLEVAFFRNFVALIVFMPWFLLRAGVGQLKTKRFDLHALRGLLHVGSMYAFFIALSFTPLNVVTAMSFSTPLFAAFFAVLILSEKMGLRRWIAVLAGFVGALVILQPGVGDINIGALMVLGGSAAWGFGLVITKILGRTDSPMTIVAYMSILMTPVSFIPALFVWQWPTAEQSIWLVAIGVCGVGANYAVVAALRIAPSTTVLPFDFVRLIWATSIGFVFFAEIPTVAAWIGGVLVFASTTYIGYREARRYRPRIQTNTEP
jgi:drug/metabolite transporter (DMT)-like permease